MCLACSPSWGFHASHVLPLGLHAFPHVLPLGASCFLCMFCLLGLHVFLYIGSHVPGTWPSPISHAIHGSGASCSAILHYLASESGGYAFMVAEPLLRYRFLSQGLSHRKRSLHSQVQGGRHTAATRHSLPGMWDSSPGPCTEKKLLPPKPERVYPSHERLRQQCASQSQT